MLLGKNVVKFTLSLDLRHLFFVFRVDILLCQIYLVVSEFLDGDPLVLHCR